jgi:site-specific recombinase XerD
MTAQLVDRAKAERELRARSVVGKLAHEVPELADLDEATLEKIARLALVDEVKAKLKKAVDLERVDYKAERNRFVSTTSRTGSPRTRKLYAKALSRLDAWCTKQGISPLELTPARADDWINAEKAEGRASATVNLDISGCSAFWTWMERRHSELRNPFRGTRERPAKKAAHKLAVPSDSEIRELEAAAAPWLKAAIVLMGQGGLRVGGLPGLSINGARWPTVTKGKEQSGTMPQEAREAILKAELPLRSPFGEFSAQKIAKAFAYLTRKLLAEGRIKARYSVHALRHAFAVRLYQNTRDIYLVSKALGHANVSVTEIYLRSIVLET